jgi:PAS domain S-box-containing protein
MADRDDLMTHIATGSDSSVSEFADSYASFNRIINTLQRKYIELKEDFSSQHEQLAEANRQLVDLSARNLVATGFLNGVLESIAAGVIAVDSRGIITHFNPAAANMLGIPAREPVGKHYREVIPPGDPVEVNAFRAAETGHAVESIEKCIDLADGTRLMVSVSTAIIKDEAGESCGAVEVFHDLTKIKRMEREIARLNTLAALGEMAAAVAHQVRNPLSGILGYGSLLKRDLEPDDPRQKLVARITDGVEALNKTVTTLLDYTRNDEINRERVRLDEFLSSTVRQFKRDHDILAHDMNFEVSRSGPPSEESDQYQLDPVLMRQVLLNLFTNASEACRGAGTVAIEYQKLPRQKAAQLYSEKVMLALDETVFEISVQDSGPGIPEESLDSIFAPFFTTREGGTGLGLAVAWKVIKAHGGEILVDNPPSGGARFKILLPVRMMPVVTPG